jgi:hypothetical protein
MDVSALGKGNHTLTISNIWPKLIGLSALNGVYSLNLSGYGGQSIFGFTNVTILDISFCSKITDISFLGDSVKELNMSLCSRITDITMLSSVKVLNISNCSQLKHFHGLRSLRDLTMVDVDFEVLSGFETFSQLEKLSIAEVVDHKELLPYIKHVKDLNLGFSSFNIHDFPSVQFLFAGQDIDPSKLILLQCLRELELRGHSRADVHLVIPFLPFLRKVKLARFRKMKKLEILGCSSGTIATDNLSLGEGQVTNSIKSFPIYHVELEENFQLEEILLSRRIAFMKTLGCDKLVNVVNANLVNRLITEGSERVTLS